MSGKRILVSISLIVMATIFNSSKQFRCMVIQLLENEFLIILLLSFVFLQLDLQVHLEYWLITTSVNKSGINDIEVLFHLVAVVVCFWPFGSKSFWTDPFFPWVVRFFGLFFQTNLLVMSMSFVLFWLIFVLLCTLFVFYQQRIKIL
jgi:hypothetical protein